MGQPTCSECGEVLTGRRRTTCSQSCKIKRDARLRRAKPGYNEYKRRENAKYRGTELRARVERYSCATCGAECVPGRNVVAHASKFCSAKCKKRWHVTHSPTHADTDRRNRRRRTAARKAATAARGSSGTGRWGGHICSECGTTYIGRLNQSDSRARNVYCGPTCKNRYFARVRRAQLRNVGMGDPVRRHEIYERDGYRCQLCNKPVKRDAVVPHPKAPVLDHIIPLGKNGTHEPANVQLAHFMCNSIKSDNIGGAGDQLRLIG